MENNTSHVFQVFSIESLIDTHPHLIDGRCLGFCCEWIYLCMSQGGVSKLEQFNKTRINESQQLYETQYQSEVKLLSHIYKIDATEVIRLPKEEGCATKAKTIKFLFSIMKKTPVGNPIIIGLSSYRGKHSFGHALGWRSYNPNPENPSIIYYEFLDSITGFWRSDDQQAIFEIIESILSKTHDGFLPSGRTSEKYIYRFIEVNCANQEQWKTQKLSYEELIWPFKGVFTKPVEIKEEPDKTTESIDEQKLRETLLSNIPTPEEKKKSLLIIASVTDKQWKQNCEFPASNNKLAKIKYSEFRSIWESFCKNATLTQLEQFQKKLSITL